ncbi:MAG: large subunit ribosomal protein [Solirubrobacteraceae bacterium]|jgi:ribosomal protein L22|nr:large subunit ribosomal protein [Solirubrobacteraceae bacterium]
MSAEEEKDEATTPADAPEAKKPAAKKAAAKKPAKATAKAAEAKPASEGKKPAAKKAAKKPAAAKEPVAGEKKERAKAAAKPQRRRIVRAHARYVRTSARKARMVCGHLRGKSVQEARAILAFTPREVARDWSKLLESAVANAESNHELVEDELIVREAYADEGPTIKRFRPRAMGRATPIRKRTTHLTIALTTETTQRTSKRNG